MNKELKSAVYGAAIGDALGVPYEFKQRGTFQCKDSFIKDSKRFLKPGTWSDDTSLILATCDSLKNNHLKIDIADIRTCFLLWLEKGTYSIDNYRFDVGNTTYYALTYGIDQQKTNDGNGSLMRILPLAFVNSTAQDIIQVSSITHKSQKAINCCLIYIKCLKKILQEKNKEKSIPDYVKKIKNKNFLRSTGYVIDSLIASLWCFYNTSTFEESIITAVNLGGDTDTIASLTGGISGLYYGYENIPNKYINDLRGKDIINNCLF